MKPSVVITTAYASEPPFEVDDLLSVRDALWARIRERRISIRSALPVVGDCLAAALAEAPPSTLRFFLDANESGLSSLQTLRSLSRDLDVSPFVAMTGVRAEISPALRLHLRVQAQRLEALLHTLSSVETQLVGFTQRAPQFAQR